MKISTKGRYALRFMLDLAANSEGRYLPLQDDISSVAYWYSDTLDDIYPAFPSKNDLEII